MATFSVGFENAQDWPVLLTVWDENASAGGIVRILEHSLPPRSAVAVECVADEAGRVCVRWETVGGPEGRRLRTGLGTLSPGEVVTLNADP